MKRWLFTALSFAAVIGVSIYAVLSGGPHGVDLTIPLRAHALALLAFVVEVSARSIKLTWSAKAVGSRLPFRTSVRTSLGGDFGASITPARMGAEPARYLILAEAGIPATDAMLILYAELFFEISEHRWFLSESQGHDVGRAAAVKSYVDTVLRYLPDAKVEVLTGPPTEEFPAITG